MNKVAFHSAGEFDIDMFVNRFRVQRFVFLADSVAFNITGFTWQFVVKTNPGDLRNIISLTLGHGLSFPIYEENVIEARFESTTTNIQEGEYFWYLIRTDTNEPLLNGKAKFGFGPFNSDGSSQEATINLLNQEVIVNLQSIVYVNESGTIGFAAELNAALGAFPSGTFFAGQMVKVINGGDIDGLPVGAGSILIAMQDSPTEDWNALTGWKLI